MTTDTWQTVGLIVLPILFYATSTYLFGLIVDLGTRIAALEERLSDTQRRLIEVDHRKE